MSLGNNLSGAIGSIGSLLLASLSQLLTLRLIFIATPVIILVVQYEGSPWRKVPPGPKGLPILGNAFQLQNKGWMFGRECKRKFGSSNSVFFLPTPWPLEFTIELSERMMYLNALGQPILVINDLKTAFELLDRRASIYSDRPHLIVGNGILCRGLFTASMSYGDVLVCPLF
jgi:hypothetical protein